MATSLASALLKIPVRKDVAMTGEITLRGNVLPIGGLKEKALAAHRGGIRNIIISHENEKDLKEIPKSIAKELHFISVKHADEVLRNALELEKPDDFLQSLERFDIDIYAEGAEKVATKKDKTNKPENIVH